MKIFNWKILYTYRLKWALAFRIANFKTKELYDMYFLITSVYPWLLPHYEAEFGKNKVSLYGWLLFYLGRQTVGVIGQDENEVDSDKKVITDRYGNTYKAYLFQDKEMTKRLRYLIRNYHCDIAIEEKDGEVTIVNRVMGEKVIFKISKKIKRAFR